MQPLQGNKDAGTVTSQGESKQKMIDGVQVRYAVTHVDERGTLTEIYNPAWGLLEEPLVYVYQASIQPGKIKGWVQHHLQTERLFVSRGLLRFVLYDDREDSPTRGTINQVYLSEHNRGLVVVPRFVWHAVQNIGSQEAFFMNMPTVPAISGKR